MMLLPSLIFGAQIKGPRVLEVGREHDSFVSRLTRKLNAQVPRVEGDKGKFGVVGYEVILCEFVKAIDGVTEGARCANMLPCEGGQACWRTRQRMKGNVKRSSTYCIVGLLAY